MAASTTLALVDSILKEVYEDSIRDQLQSHITTLKRIEKTSEGVTNRVGGKYVVFPIRTKRNHGIGARNENEPLPTARSQGYEDAQVRLKYLYGSISLTGPTLKLAEKEFQVFSSALEQEISGLQENLRKDTNRQVYGTTLGTLATIPTGSGSSSTTHTVTNAQYLEFGMIVDVYTSGGVAVVEEVEILDVNQDTGVVTFDTSFDSSDGDTIHRWRSRGKEKTGFQEIVAASGTLFGIDPTVTPIWKSFVDDNSGVNRALSESLMVATADEVYKRGSSTSVIFCNLGVRRAYFNLLVQQRRYTNTQKFEGGFTGLAFTTDRGDIPVVADVDCQPNRMYFLNEKEIKLYQEADWSWMDMDGSKWTRITTAEGDFDAYKATMFKYCELGTHRRNAHALLTDLTEAS